MDVICVERVLEPFHLVMKIAHLPPMWPSAEMILFGGLLSV